MSKPPRKTRKAAASLSASASYSGAPVGPAKLPPMREAGVSGTPLYGGYVRTNELNAKLVGLQRYRTAADILTNTSIVAAGVRYFLNLVAKPKWKVKPADDSDAAKQVAEFVEEVLFGMGTSWSRIIRRSGMYRWHGFGVGEWTAIKRDDGKIGLKDIEQRPQYTIEKWAADEQGNILGVWQRAPQNGQLLWIPRSKMVYLVDDMMTDSPEGMGWFRACAEPAERLKRFMEVETTGYERNLAGIPIGRIPYAEINNAVKSNALTQAQADEIINAIEDFVSLQAKDQATSIVLDSAPYESITDQGTTISTVYKYGIDLLKGDVSGMTDLGKSIDRDIHQLARIIGVENLLLGADGKGSLALSKTNAESMYLVINSTVQDMAEAYDRDGIGPIMDLNGIPDKLRPTLDAEDVAFKDVVEISTTLMNMATAGAVLQPDDPAINELRGLMGISDQKEMTTQMIAQRMGMGTGPGGRGAPGQPGQSGAGGGGAPDKGDAAPSPEAQDGAGNKQGADGKPAPKPRARAKA